VFVTLAEIPLTANGKIDRRRLPQPDASRPELEAGYVAPVTEVEQSIAGIWADVLGLDRVGVNDNFFELGGHSLLATTIAARIYELFEIELPLRTLFEAPTVATLATAIENAKRGDSVSVAPPEIVPLSRDSLRRSRLDLRQA
jgi:acyl carrier protein